MSDTKSFDASNIFRRHNPSIRNTELPDQTWYLPMTESYSKGIKDLLIRIESQWMKELGEQFNQLALYDPELAKNFPIPRSPMRYGDAVAYQILRQDFRLLEVEAAALGFALVPISVVHLFDPTQIRLMSNKDRIMEILNAYGSAERNR